jgi:hypothetical protein
MALFGGIRAEQCSALRGSWRHSAGVPLRRRKGQFGSGKGLKMLTNFDFLSPGIFYHPRSVEETKTHRFDIID